MYHRHGYTFHSPFLSSIFYYRSFKKHFGHSTGHRHLMELGRDHFHKNPQICVWPCAPHKLSIFHYLSTVHECCTNGNSVYLLEHFSSEQAFFDYTYRCYLNGKRGKSHVIYVNNSNRKLLYILGKRPKIFTVTIKHFNHVLIVVTVNF